MKVEGKNAVMQLLDSGINIDKLLIQNNLKGEMNRIMFLASKRKIKIQLVEKVVLDRQSETNHHQGVIAYATDYNYKTIEDAFDLAKSKNEQPFFVICDGIEDPHNLGAIIRSCECAGVHGIIISKNRCFQVTDTVIKVSTGACFDINVIRVENINQTIRQLKEMNVFIFGLEANGENIYKTDFTGAIGLVVGSEGFGVSKLTKDLCDGIVSLPLNGKINSLNASNACAIGVYEVVRQRYLKNGK